MDLLRLAPDHPSASLARRELRRLQREPLAVLPNLEGHRNLAWLPGERVAGATAKQLYTLDLRQELLEWVPQGEPSARGPSRIEARGGQAWLSLAKPKAALFDLAPGRAGQGIEADPAWSLRPVSLVSLALSPSGSWALSGGAGDLVLWDLQARRAAAHLRLERGAHADDIQVEKLVFLDEERAFGILNLRRRESLSSRLEPLEGSIFQVHRRDGQLELIGHQELGASAHALAVGGGDVFASGDGGGFVRYLPERFAERPERLGVLRTGVRRVVDVAWIRPGLIVSARDVSTATTRRTQLGRWRLKDETWRYTKFGSSEMLRAIFYAPERELLLGSARQSSVTRGGPAGAIWFLGRVGE